MEKADLRLVIELRVMLDYFEDRVRHIDYEYNNPFENTTVVQQVGYVLTQPEHRKWLDEITEREWNELGRRPAAH